MNQPEYYDEEEAVYSHSMSQEGIEENSMPICDAVCKICKEIEGYCWINNDFVCSDCEDKEVGNEYEKISGIKCNRYKSRIEAVK